MPSDRVQKVVRVSQEGFVAEPQYSEPCVRQLQITRRILNLPKPVDAAVQLDNKHELGTKEVCDRARDRDLTAEFQALEISASQHFPEVGFRARHDRAQSARLARSGFCLVHRPDIPLIRPAARATFSP
jgi:hypothetical protein